MKARYSNFQMMLGFDVCLQGFKNSTTELYYLILYDCICSSQYRTGSSWLAASGTCKTYVLIDMQ